MAVTDLISQMFEHRTNAEGARISEPPRITFPLPKNFVLPDGLNAGDLFNATGTFRVGESGLMELVQVNGLPVDPDQSIEGSEADPNPSSPSALGDNGVTNQVTPSGWKMPRNMLNFLMANRANMRR
jgi:hypothetical protein